jgi:hypothetical protein
MGFVALKPGTMIGILTWTGTDIPTWTSIWTCSSIWTGTGSETGTGKLNGAVGLDFVSLGIRLLEGLGIFLFFQMLFQCLCLKTLLEDLSRTVLK